MNVYVGLGSILYSDSGTPLLEVVEDTIGRHDTVYGCCSNPNNMLRYGVETTESCYTNFEAELAKLEWAKKDSSQCELLCQCLYWKMDQQ